MYSVQQASDHSIPSIRIAPLPLEMPRSFFVLSVCLLSPHITPIKEIVLPTLLAYDYGRMMPKLKNSNQSSKSEDIVLDKNFRARHAPHTSLVEKHRLRAYMKLIEQILELGVSMFELTCSHSTYLR